MLLAEPEGVFTFGGEVRAALAACVPKTSATGILNVTTKSRYRPMLHIR
jgi:hypothetical protein